ncbi:MAG TPA: response regulator [Phycisphaerae bacterium]|nr:response regulator [Phycisphaerae bacterium]
MSSRVLSVGQCGYDDSRIGQVVKSTLGAFVERAHSGEEAKRLLSEKSYALVLVNRQFDAGGSGLELISELKGAGVSTPVMLVSDYADAQAAAIAAGAVRGFGKSALASERTRQALLEAVAEAGEARTSS